MTLPRSVECLHGYTGRAFSADLIAGITVGLVALPLARAFAIASGLKPEAGIYTAVVAGIVAKFGVSGLALVGMMAGVLLLLMGLTTPAVPGEFVPRIRALLECAGTTRWETIAVAATSLAIILLLPKWIRRIPGSIAALMLSAVATAAFHRPLETIGSKFGGIPPGLPSFAIPHFQAEHLLLLLPSAFTVAFLAAIEGLLIPSWPME